MIDLSGVIIGASVVSVLAGSKGLELEGCAAPSSGNRNLTFNQSQWSTW